MALNAWLIYYLVQAGVVLSVLAQLLNFFSGGPRNRRRWAGLAFGIIAAGSVSIAGQRTKQALEWRRVSDHQEAILSQKLSGTNAKGNFVVLSLDDPKQGEYFMSISGVCNELHIACQLYPTKTRYPTISPPPGVLAFAFDDADHRLIDAFTAAGLISAKAGTSVGTELLPAGITEGIIIGPKPSPLGPEVWRTNAPEPR